MANVPRQILDAIPGVFRPRFPGMPRRKIGNDLPEDGGYTGNYPQTDMMDRFQRPAALNVLQQNPAPQPVQTPTNVLQPQVQQPARPVPETPTYDTQLSPAEEQSFQQWKRQYAPNDSGADYDLRGAYRSGLKPDPKTGHWPDTYKKPNHPTFSNQSQYATGANAAKAGRWEGDKFIPATAATNPHGIVTNAPTPPRPAGVPANAHWDATGIGPDGGEWIGPGPQPNVLNPTVVSPGAPEVSPSGVMNDRYQTRQDRRVETDKRGRPTPNITMEGDEQTLDQYDRLARMPPDKRGGGWWPRIRSALLGFAVGGPAGAAAGFGAHLLKEKFDPEAASREYQRQQMGQLKPAVDSIYARRKEARAEEAQDAATGLAKARTEALKNPKAAASRILKGADGYYSFNPDTKKYEKINEIPTPAGAAKGARYFQNAAGVFRVDPDNPDVGVRVKGIPGTPGKAGQDVEFGNAQVRAALKRKRDELTAIDADLTRLKEASQYEVETTNVYTGEKTKKKNPAYQDLEDRRRQVNDKIDEFELKLKSPTKMAAVEEPEEDEEEDDDPLGILDKP